MVTRFDVGLLNDVATMKPVQTNQIPRRSSLREYGLRGDTRAAIGGLKTAAEDYNKRIPEAQSAMSEYQTNAAAYNAEMDVVDRVSARAQANPSNAKGLMAALGGYPERLYQAAGKANMAVRKITGGDEVRYTDQDLALGGKSYADVVESDIIGDVPQFDLDGSPMAPSRAVVGYNFKVKDAARTGIDAGNIDQRAKEVEALTRRDVKRRDAPSGLLAADNADSEKGANSPFQSQFSSLSKYRKG